MILILDASPLITLARSGSLELLRRLADQIVIPEAVYIESVGQASGRPGSTEIAQAHWIVRRPVQNQTDVLRLRTRLGWGEAEAIVLTREIRADAVVLDDATARHIAEQEGCRVIGLLGLLVAMRNSGFFIGDDLYTTILHQTAEK